MKLPELKEKENKSKIKIIPIIIVAALCFMLGSNYNAQKDSKFNEQLRSKYADMTVTKDSNGNDVKEYKLKDPQTNNATSNTTNDTSIEKTADNSNQDNSNQNTSNEQTPNKETTPNKEVTPAQTNPPQQNTTTPNNPQDIKDVNPKTGNIDNGNYLVIGDISLGEDYNKAYNMYKDYYMYDGPNNQKFFNDDKNGYGNFLLTIGVDNTNRVNRIAYDLFNDVKNIPTINIGDIPAGSSIERLKEVYGDWDDLTEQNNVKTITYNNFSYNDQPVYLIFYIDKPTQKVYGYEIKFK